MIPTGNGKPLVVWFQVVVGAELRIGRVLLLQALGGLRIFLLQLCLDRRIFTVFHSCVQRRTLALLRPDAAFHRALRLRQLIRAAVGFGIDRLVIVPANARQERCEGMAAVIAAHAQRIFRVAGRIQQVIELRVLASDAVHLALPAGMIGDRIGIGYTRAQMLRHQHMIPAHVFALLDRHVTG